MLVTGGAGAVGNATIQLARWYGAQVLATVSSERKARLARDAGAHQALDYRAADITEQLPTAAPQGIHHVVDVALADNLAAYLDALVPHAFVASYASPPEPVVRLPLRRMRSANVTISFVLVYNLTTGMLQRAIADITAALQAGALRPLPALRFTLDDIAAAHEAVERHAVGKVLVQIP